MNSTNKNKYMYRKSRNALDPKERVAVIKRYLYLHESMKDISARYNCSLTQVKNIIRHRKKFLSEKDKLEVKTESYSFLTIGCIISEFAQRWNARRRQLTDEIIYQKAWEIEKYIKVSGRLCMSSHAWLRRVKNTFWLSEERPLRTSLQWERENKSQKSLAIIDIIKEMMESYDEQSTEPQVLRMSQMKKYLKNPSKVCSDDEEERNAADEDEEDDYSEDNYMVMSQNNRPNRISTSPDNNDDHDIVMNEIYPPIGISTSPCIIKEELDDSSGDSLIEVQGHFPNGVSGPIVQMNTDLGASGGDQDYCLVEILDDMEIAKIKMEEGGDYSGAKMTDSVTTTTTTVNNKGASEGMQLENPRGKLKSYEDALKYLGPLEEFALLRTDIRATGLINQLENLFNDKLKEEIS